jgi:hypothetical protein
LRLDGTTDVRERQSRVNRFNDKNNNLFVFLLSTKAGMKQIKKKQKQKNLNTIKRSKQTEQKKTKRPKQQF